jgi:hypothetical protein
MRRQRQRMATMTMMMSGTGKDQRPTVDGIED